MKNTKATNEIEKMKSENFGGELSFKDALQLHLWSELVAQGFVQPVFSGNSVQVQSKKRKRRYPTHLDREDHRLVSLLPVALKHPMVSPEGHRVHRQDPPDLLVNFGGMLAGGCRHVKQAFDQP